MCSKLQDNTAAVNAAMDAKLRRMNQPKGKTGAIEVPDWVHQEWLKGGAARKVLVQSMIECKGDKVPRELSHSILGS